MARGELGVEHLLRRAGFGASPDDLEAVRRHLRVRRARSSYSTTRSQPDDVDTKIGMPGYAVDQSGQRLLSEPEHRTCAPALALPDGAYEAAAPGEDGALLAQPLRDGVHARSPARRRAAQAHADDGAQSGRAARPAGSDRTVPRAWHWEVFAICSSRWRRTRRCSSGSTAV